MVFQGTSHLKAAVPPIVISKYCKGSQPGFELAEALSNLLRFDESTANDTVDNEVARKENEIRSGRIGKGHDFFQFIDAIERGTHMKIG